MLRKQKDKQTEILSYKNLAPVKVDNIQSQADEPFKLAEKTRVKYNKTFCTKVTLTTAAIKPLQAAYHKIHGLPSFVNRFVHGRPTLERALFVNAPEMFHIFNTPYDTSKTILMTNPEYVDHKKFLEDCKKESTSEALKKLKNAPQGLGLVTWYLHPASLPKELQAVDSNDALQTRLTQLKKQAEVFGDEAKKFNYYRYGQESMSSLQRVTSFSKLPRSESQATISDMESKSEIPYLACIFDLDDNKEKSLIYLKDMRANILHDLETIYGVTPEDKIKIYIHMPYLDTTTTLHLHIRINQGDHALENAKSFGLNEIIEQLESGSSVADMVIKRGAILCTEYPIGEGIEGINVETVPNPKRDWKDIFSKLSAHPDTQEYLLQSIEYPEVLARMQLLDFDEIDKLATQINFLTDMPSATVLIEMMKKLKINSELGKLGWSLETGTQATQDLSTKMNHRF